MTDWAALFPIGLIVIGAMVVLLLEVLLPDSLKRALPYVTIAFLGFAWFETWLIQAVHIGNSTHAFQLDPLNGFFVLDHFASFFYLFLLLATIVCVLISPAYLSRESLVHGEYYALLLFALCGAMILASSQDLMTLFIGLEIMSMAVYILVGWRRGMLQSIEASFKYFILGSLASAILLYGIALLYGSVGSTRLEAIGIFFNQGSSTLTAELAVLMLLTGFAFKIAAVPFQMWAPDAYEGAPMPVTAFMATVVKGAAFAFLLRTLLVSLNGIIEVWTPILWWLAVLTLLFGNLYAMAQENVKRLMAYSSIVHTGYLLVGVVALTSQADNQALTAVLYYLYVYSLATLGAFTALSFLSGNKEKYVLISDYAGLAREYPFMAFFLTLSLFSLIGIPPLGGFLGKYYIFTAAISEGFTLLVLLAAISSILSIYYYLRLIVTMYMHPTQEHWMAPRVRPLMLGFVLLYLGIALTWAGMGPVDILNLFPGVETLSAWVQLAS